MGKNRRDILAYNTSLVGLEYFQGIPQTFAPKNFKTKFRIRRNEGNFNFGSSTSTVFTGCA